MFDFSLKKDGYFPPIARWKLFNDEESELAKRADESFEGKVAYVNYYKKNDSVYYNNGLKYVEQAIAKFDSKQKMNECMKEIKQYVKVVVE
jgi:hypothetical protein